jgi:ElaB/YqjD/DUF883 family membrane-anchored ribosome-binding protein
MGGGLSDSNVFKNAATSGGLFGNNVEKRTRNVKEAYNREVNKVMLSIRNEKDPAKIEAAMDKLDKLKNDMEDALDNIKDNSGCHDTQCVDQAREAMEQMSMDAEKFAMDQEWGGKAPDFLRTPTVTP